MYIDACWSAVMCEQNRERTELRFELTMAERARMLRTNARHRATSDMMNGIDAFEKNMKRLGRYASCYISACNMFTPRSDCHVCALLHAVGHNHHAN